MVAIPTDYLLHNYQDRREYEQGNMKLRIIDLGDEDNEVVRSVYLNEDQFTDVVGGRREIRIHLEGAIPQPWGGTDREHESQLSQAYFEGYLHGVNQNIGSTDARWWDLPLTFEEFKEMADGKVYPKQE